MTTQTVKLGDVCEINKASIGRDYAFDSIEYLDTSSVTSGAFSETEHLSLADAPSRAKRIVQNNDIVISTVRPNLRHFGIIKNAKPNMIVSTGFAVLTIDESKADYSYIYYLLTKDDIVDYLSAVADQAVSTYPAFNPSVLANLDLTLPAPCGAAACGRDFGQFGRKNRKQPPPHPHHRSPRPHPLQKTHCQ